MRRRNWQRITLVIVVLLAIVVAAAIWTLPLRYVGDVRVEEAQIVVASGDAAIYRASPTPQGRILVTFSTPVNLADLRRSSGLGFVTANLTDCANSTAMAREVIDQGAGYLTDDGRVHTLPIRDGRYRYQVTFLNELTRLIDHRFQRERASDTSGGLCFSVGGSAMWFGYLWSNTVSLGPLVRRPLTPPSPHSPQTPAA